jgi:hypothetical protein
MTIRRVILFGALLVVTMVALLTWLPGDGIDPQTLEKIRGGTTAAEVETILGRRADSKQNLLEDIDFPSAHRRFYLCRWNGRSGSICLYFDGNQRVTDGFWDTNPRGPNSKLQEILRWIGL